MAYKLFQYKHQYKDRSTLILFSGDFFGTSELSIRTEGEYAPEILNAFNIDYAIYGNHEFDHGLGSDAIIYLPLTSLRFNQLRFKKAERVR